MFSWGHNEAISSKLFSEFSVTSTLIAEIEFLEIFIEKKFTVLENRIGLKRKIFTLEELFGILPYSPKLHTLVKLF